MRILIGQKKAGGFCRVDMRWVQKGVWIGETWGLSGRREEMGGCCTDGRNQRNTVMTPKTIRTVLEGQWKLKRILEGL